MTNKETNRHCFGGLPDCHCVQVYRCLLELEHRCLLELEALKKYPAWYVQQRDLSELESMVRGHDQALK